MEIISMISYIKITIITKKKLWRTVEKRTRYKSDPIWHIISISKKTFTKVIF